MFVYSDIKIFLVELPSILRITISFLSFRKIKAKINAVPNIAFKKTIFKNFSFCIE